ncbi:MAG: NUDIX hydrolase [bacterium]|nr:NUDIX hydrolase [bacterium]
MDREALVGLLDRYEKRHPDERDTLDRIRALLGARDDAFERTCFEPGHITSSAWIVSRESGAALFTHHRKLERWLQLGGHADGETDVLASALREAEEESGLEGFRALPAIGGPEILDVDVHEIPARKHEPAHEHHDIRFLLEVSDAQPIVRADRESKEIRWFAPEEVAARFDEESILRMARKAAEWAARLPVGPS